LAVVVVLVSVFMVVGGTVTMTRMLVSVADPLVDPVDAAGV